MIVTAIKNNGVNGLINSPNIKNIETTNVAKLAEVIQTKNLALPVKPVYVKYDATVATKNRRHD